MKHLGKRLVNNFPKMCFGKRKLSCFSEDIMRRDCKFGSRHTRMLPVVLDRAEGANVWDVDGCRYIDFLGAFATLNMGHSHPRLVKAMQDQSCKLAHTSRAYYTREHGALAAHLTAISGYDRFIPLNTGSEACDMAVKIARLWAYRTKRIEKDNAVILFAKNYHCGSTLGAMSCSTNKYCKDFGPLVPGFECVPFNDTQCLEEKLVKNPNICAFIVEPIQYEGGADLPTDGYLNCVRELCTKYKILMIADELQTGFGRTGKLFAVNHECVHPDLMIVGKALSGGMYPVSGVLGNDELILNLEEGSHASTYGGSPLGQKVALEALRVMESECLAENAVIMGHILREELRLIPCEMSLGYKGRGLLAGLEICPSFASGWEICRKLLKRGLLTRPARDQVIRISPPLNICEQEIREAIYIIITTLIEHKECKCR